jgi:hypothetical protein
MAYSTPAEIAAALKRCGIPASERAQQMIRLEGLIDALRSEVGRLALAAKALAEAAQRVADER